MAAQVAGNAGAGHAPDFGGNFLDRHHERKTQYEGPGQTIAERRADLAVRANPARVVVGRARNQSGTERPQKCPQTEWPVGAGYAGAILRHTSRDVVRRVVGDAWHGRIRPAGPGRARDWR